METSTIKRVRGTFIGQDGSLGFEKNKRYVLHIRHVAENILIHDTENGHKCEYSSVVALLNNWDNISKWKR